MKLIRSPLQSVVQSLNEIYKLLSWLSLNQNVFHVFRGTNIKLVKST